MQAGLKALAFLAAAFAVALPGAAADTLYIGQKEKPAIPPAELAPIVLMTDMASGQVLHAREADRRFIPASITKVMTLFLAFELIDEGKLDPSQTFPVRGETFREWSGRGSSMDIGRNDIVSVDRLLTAIATISANDGAVVLAEGVAGSSERWVDMMNDKAQEIGMRDSYFGTPNGWPDEGATFVTAHDLAKLARAMVVRHPQLYRTYIGRPSFSYNGSTKQNRDPISGFVSGADGIKTGFTREAGNGFLGSAERDGRRLIMVVAGVDSQKDRAQMARSYLEWAFSSFEPRVVVGAGQQVGNARIRGGENADVGLLTNLPVAISERAGHSADVKLVVRYRGPLRAPIRQGEEVAELQVTVDGGEAVAFPLYAAREIGEGGPLDRLRDGFYSLIP